MRRLTVMEVVVYLIVLSIALRVVCHLLNMPNDLAFYGGTLLGIAVLVFCPSAFVYIYKLRRKREK